MTLKHFRKVKIDMLRKFPKRANYCRLSVYANALNFLGYENTRGNKMTPEKMLVLFNKKRIREKKKPIAPTRGGVIPITELEKIFKRLKIGKVKRFYGKKYLNLKLWKRLLEEGFLIASEHQQIYYPPKSNAISLDYIPASLLKKLVRGREFSYTKLIELYDMLIQKHGPIDFGHVDLVVDVISNKKEKAIVLANLNSVNHKPYIKIPWNFYSRYLSFDFEKDTTIDDVSKFPKRIEFEKLREEGKLPRNKYYFTSGYLEIFYKKEDGDRLKQILNEYI